MTNKVLLNNVDHADLRVIARHAPEFGDSVNQVLVFPTEFDDIQREYPIFFRRDPNGALQSVALLGLDRDENLFLDEQGWQGRYVPAVLRRGPFLIGLQEHETDGEARREPMVHIDLDDPRISKTEGLPLFLPQGGNAPYLEHVTGVLRAIYAGIDATAPMFAAFKEADLIEPVSIEIELDEARKYVLSDFLTIGRAKLAALDGAHLEKLNRAGFLGVAFLVASSMSNVRRLVDLKNAKRRANEGVPAGAA